MNMMLIHDKGFGNDMKTSVNFVWKFLVFTRKSFSQFFFGKAMVDHTGRKSIQICLSLTDRFFAAVRGDDYFRNPRLWSIRIRGGFGFIKGIKQSDLPLNETTF